MIIVKLFLAFVRVGLFAIGGAYSFLPVIEKEVVERYHWLTREEFLDMAGVATIFPGAISIKYATYTGYKLAGILGVISANIGNMLAPVLMIIFASIFYARHKELPAVKGAFDMIRLAVFAMIIAVAFQTISIRSLTEVKSLIIIMLSFFIFIYTKVHPAVVILVSGMIGAVWR